MVLSEAEAEKQLADLRRQRDALDRSIADLTLYLELGRRLRAGPSSDPASGSDKENAGRESVRHAVAVDRQAPEVSALKAPSATAVARASAEARPRRVVEPPAETTRKISDVGEGGPTEGALSEGILARRHGRALIEAALAALDEAGRPLHAGEILAVLTARGFSLPGHDPVAALNTRLWKRSGPGGPLRRMGDAVYALAETQDAG